MCGILLFVITIWYILILPQIYLSEANQEKIVEAGGLNSLLMLLSNSEDETIRRIAAGAIANLAMSGDSQPIALYSCLFISPAEDT